jgi:membrane protease YdiL (CAAX protease family)
MVTDSIPLNSRGNISSLVAQIGKSPATWLFVAVWMASALVLVVTGNGFPVVAALISAAYLLLSALTVAITQPAPASPAAPAMRPRLWLQACLILLFIVLTGWTGLVFHAVVAPDAEIPLWSPLVAYLQRLGGQALGNDNYIANPVTYVAIPLLALLLTGARLAELGFGRGHRVGWVLLLWCAIPFAFFAYALFAGQLTPARLVGRFVSNFMQNGFWEEFLFRGALQTRLRQLWTPSWALVVQSLLFGAWHLGLGYTNTGHEGWLPALASVLVHQAVVGLALGVIFERTRNLLAPSIVHIIVNSTG